MSFLELEKSEVTTDRIERLVIFDPDLIVQRVAHQRTGHVRTRALARIADRISCPARALRPPRHIQSDEGLGNPDFRTGLSGPPFLHG